MGNYSDGYRIEVHVEKCFLFGKQKYPACSFPEENEHH